MTDLRTVTLTVLVSVGVAADSKSIAEDEARRFVDGLFEGANDGFMDGWNSVNGRADIIDVTMDVEGEADID